MSDLKQLSDEELLETAKQFGFYREDAVEELWNRYNNKKKEIEKYGDHTCHRRHFGGPNSPPCDCGFSEVCEASGIPDKS